MIELERPQNTIAVISCQKKKDRSKQLCRKYRVVEKGTPKSDENGPEWSGWPRYTLAGVEFKGDVMKEISCVDARISSCSKKRSATAPAPSAKYVVGVIRFHHGSFSGFGAVPRVKIAPSPVRVSPSTVEESEGVMGKNEWSSESKCVHSNNSASSTSFRSR
jgi:hypothetical protein